MKWTVWSRWWRTKSKLPWNTPLTHFTTNCARWAAHSVTRSSHLGEKWYTLGAQLYLLPSDCTTAMETTEYNTHTTQHTQTHYSSVWDTDTTLPLQSLSWTVGLTIILRHICWYILLYTILNQIISISIYIMIFHSIAVLYIYSMYCIYTVLYYILCHIAVRYTYTIFYVILLYHTIYYVILLWQLDLMLCLISNTNTIL